MYMRNAASAVIHSLFTRSPISRSGIVHRNGDTIAWVALGLESHVDVIFVKTSDVFDNVAAASARTLASYLTCHGLDASSPEALRKISDVFYGDSWVALTCPPWDLRDAEETASRISGFVAIAQCLDE